MPLPLHRQPLKAIYILVKLLTAAVQIPVLTLAYAVPALRPHRQWTLKRVLVCSTMRTLSGILFYAGPIPPMTIEVASKDAEKTGFVWIEAASQFVVGELAELAKKNGVEAARVYGYWWGETKTVDGVAPKAKPGEKVILVAHGGGFCMGSACLHNVRVGATLSGFAEHIKGTRIFGVDYRPAAGPPFQPSFTNSFPAPLIDTLAAYHYLVEDVGFAAENVIFCGDSVGSSIIFGLLHHLRQHSFSTLPLPGAVIHLSPALDWACTHDGPHTSLRRRSDFCHAIYASGYARRIVAGVLGDAAGDSLWVSPASLNVKPAPGDFAHPRTLVVAGGAEMILDSIHTFRDRVRADIGDRLTYIEVPNATHSAINNTWQEPERTLGLRAVAQWVESL